MQNIYVVAGISVREITPEEEQRDFEAIRLMHPSWKGKTIEDYRKWTAGWQEDRWKIQVEDAAYFLDEETAIEAVQSNIGGLDDGGVYKYACVYPIYPGAYMPRTRIPDDEIRLFRFVYDKADSWYVPLIKNDQIAQIWIMNNGDDFSKEVRYYGIGEDDRLMIKRMKQAVRGCIGG